MTNTNTDSESWPDPHREDAGIPNELIKNLCTCGETDELLAEHLLRLLAAHEKQVRQKIAHAIEDEEAVETADGHPAWWYAGEYRAKLDIAQAIRRGDI